jgi:type 2 lantibiotic biosynthesis protein LanM
MKLISSNSQYLDLLIPADLLIEDRYITGLEGTFEKFCSVFSKKIQIKLEQLSNRHEEYFDNYDSFKTYSYRYLYKSILDHSIRTLITEINAFKKKRNSKKDIYEDFSNELLKLGYHRELYEKYPLLYQIIEKKIENYFRLIETFLNRMIKDFDILQNTFKINKRKITSIFISSGDFHNGGNTTVFFTMGKIKMVYKPKNLENDLLIHDIVDFLNKFPEQKSKLKHVATINKGTYGWQIAIEKSKCSHLEEVNRYYYRIGSFLSIFLLLGTDDLHNENILSCGENPYFIDLETLVKTEKGISALSGVTKNFFDEINNSVLSTMLLPTNAIYSATDCDIGGISSFNDDSSAQMKAFQLINKGTDQISLTNREVFMGSGDNHLYLNDSIVYPNNFAEEIIEGFKDTINIIRNNINSLYEIIKNRNVYSRCVIRPTFIYGSFLDASLHPTYLHQDLTRNELFQLLSTKKETKNNMYIEYEIKALMDGDIPYFHQEGKDLICNQEFIIKDFFEHHLDETIANRIKKFSAINIHRQVSYIRLSLSTLKSSHNVKKANIFKTHLYKNTDMVNVPINNQHILNSIEFEISNKLLWNESNNSCTWLTATQLNTNYSLNCANGFVYESGGVLIFYLMLYKHSNESKYLFYAESIFRGLKEMGMLKQKLNESAFVGITSHLYLAANLYQITKKDEYKIFVIDTLNQLLELEFTNLDYLNGVSGLLVLLNNLYKKIPLKETLLVAKKAINFLDKNIGQFKPETGIAHGYSGIMLGYLAAAEILNENSYLETATTIVSIENQYFDRDIKNWLDLRDNQSFNYGWCRGSSGIAFVRSKLNKAIGQHDSFDLSCSLDTTLKAIETNKYNDDSLCHGLYGAIDNLIDIEKSLSDSISEYNLSQRLSLNLKEMTSNGFRYGVTSLIESENFFVGSTGLGYLVLRVENKELPSILHLELF